MPLFAQKIVWAIIGILFVAASILAVWKLPQLQVHGYRERAEAHIAQAKPEDRVALQVQLEKEIVTAETAARTALAQIIGGLFAAFGLYVAWRTVQVNEEGKLTDRFSKAVEMLGSKVLDVRLGGIYALERIARDSQKDHWTVMEVLTAFVRRRTKPKVEASAASPQSQPPDSGEPAWSKKPRADIQAAINVIGRRKWWEQEEPHQRLDLRGTDLGGVDLPQSHLERACFTNANLVWAIFHEAHLTGAELSGARLNQADLSEAHLERAILNGAKLEGTNLKSAHLDGTQLLHARLFKACLTEADLTGADLTGARFYDPEQGDDSKAKGLTWEQLSKADPNGRPVLPPDLQVLWDERQQKRKQPEPSPPAPQNKQP